MSKLDKLEKVREMLVKLKENIDKADDDTLEHQSYKLEAEARQLKAEEEAESYRRRIKLLEVELDKAKATLTEKQDRLGHLEDRSTDDDEKRREYEGIEMERDDQLVAIEEEALSAKRQVQEANHTLTEAERKLQVIEGEVERAEQRYQAAITKEQSFLDVIERNSEELRTLEDRDNEAAEREMEAEEKLRFLEEQLKEAVTRAENSERDVVRNENIVISIKNDLQGWRDKHTEIEKEIERIDDLVNELEGNHAIVDEPQSPLEED